MRAEHKNILKYVGIICASYRKSISKVQADIVHDLKISQGAVSRFERGEANDALILLWYICHGLDSNIIADLIDLGGK